MGRHLLHGSCGVCPFIDLWLLEKHFSAEKSRLDELLIQCNLKALYDASMELSRVWLEGQKHSKVTEQFEQYILCGGTYGTTANAEQNPQKWTLNKKTSCGRIEISTTGGFLLGKQKRTKTLSRKYKERNSRRIQKRCWIELVSTQVWNNAVNVKSGNSIR